jgi:anion-transporting  ArsA/GET3 family ATPase
VAAARQERRTLVVELAGRAEVARILGGGGGGPLEELELEPHLYHVGIERQAALRDYLDHEVPGPIRAGRLTGNRTFSAFIDATPGMAQLLSVGKLSELARSKRSRRGAQPYDLVILDGPEGAQLITLLRAPRAFGSIAGAGPVARQTAAIDHLLTDPAQTGVIAVTIPEPAAVAETLDLGDALERARGASFDAVVLNRVLSSRVRVREAGALRAASDDPAVRSAQWLQACSRAQRKEIRRLRGDLAGIPQVSLPYVFEGIDRAALEPLAVRLGRGLG